MSTLTRPVGTTPARGVPRLAGINRTVLALELRRMLRNRRTVIFTIVLPVALLLSVGNQSGWREPAGSGNLAAYLLVSMGLYGAALTAAATGAGVALERTQGWTRQLRLTPQHPVAHILVKTTVALTAGTLSVAAVNVAGLVQGHAAMPTGTWVACAVVTVVSTLTFAALGVFVGYLVPGENAMQVLGPGLALLSFLGGVFIPLSQYSPLVRDIAYWTPLYGVSEAARAPLTHELPWFAVVNAVAWLALFVAGATWRMSRDTARD